MPERPTASELWPTVDWSADETPAVTSWRTAQSGEVNSGSGVFTSITPPSASEPNGAEPGPLTTVMDSTRHGSTSEVYWFGAGRKIALLRRMPSTSTSTALPIKPRTIGTPCPGPVRCTATPAVPLS
jgi:hypothetical protein